MDWTYRGEPSLVVPDGKIGFVYTTHYSDGSYYIGKKLCMSLKRLPAIKQPRKNSTRVIKLIYRDHLGAQIVGKKNIRDAKKLGIKGKMEEYDIMENELKWKEYEGSSDISGEYTLVAKEIVAWCNTKIAMTYMEADLQFRTGSLFDDKCLNLNILGKFFPNVFDMEDTDEREICKNEKQGTS